MLTKQEIEIIKCTKYENADKEETKKEVRWKDASKEKIWNDYLKNSMSEADEKMTETKMNIKGDEKEDDDMVYSDLPKLIDIEKK